MDLCVNKLVSKQVIKLIIIEYNLDALCIIKCNLLYINKLKNYNYLTYRKNNYTILTYFIFTLRDNK